MTGTLHFINPIITIPIIMEKYTIGRELLIGGTKIKKKKKDFNFTSEEAEKFINRNRVSDKLFEDIVKISKGDKLIQMCFVSKGIETNQWIRFAIYYMTDPLATEILFADNESRELVNGITTLAGFGKVYESEGIADINLYDSSKLTFGYNGRFLLNKLELIDFLSTPHFQAAMASKIVRRKQMLQEANNIDEQKYIEGSVVNTVEDRKPCANPAFDMLKDEPVENLFKVHDDPNSITPIEFGNKEKTVVPKRGANVPVNIYDKFEKVFSTFIPETISYHYENINGFYHLFITRPDSGAEEYYILDDGSIMGGADVSILANYINNGIERAIFINTKKHPAITSKVLERTLFNYLTPEEVEDCVGDYFYNMEIYHTFDFYDSEWINDLTAKDKYNFETNLLGIISVPILKGVRLKVSEYIDANHFTCVSDYSLHRPLPYIQNKPMPETDVADGLKVYVDGDSIYIDYLGEVKKYTMGKATHEQ